jgi:Spy/CpxP family protein refolding chaperone
MKVLWIKQLLDSTRLNDLCPGYLPDLILSRFWPPAALAAVRGERVPLNSGPGRLSIIPFLRRLRVFKKTFIITVLSLFLCMPLMAESIGAPGQKLPTMRLKALRRQLNLTPDQIGNLKSTIQSQKAQRQALAKDRRQKVEALHSLLTQNNPNPTDVGNATLALRKARAQSNAIREQAIQSFKSTLTPDQLKTYESLQLKRKKG